MIFTNNTLSDIQARIAEIKAANTSQSDHKPKQIPMVNGTIATKHQLNLHDLTRWAYDEYFENDTFKTFILSQAACDPALYQFIDEAGNYLYTGKSGIGISRVTEHITGGNRANKILHAYIANNRPRSMLFTVVYYHLTLSPDLPPEWKERTILAAETRLIKRNPTLLNVLHNQRQET